MVKRNLADAKVEAISPDTRFGCAYEAALILATAAIACSGHRVKGLGHHRTTFEAIPLALPGEESVEDSRYFDRCRWLRNEFSYEAAGVVEEREVEELLARVAQFQLRVKVFLEAAYPQVWS